MVDFNFGNSQLSLWKHLVLFKARLLLHLTALNPIDLIY